MLFVADDAQSSDQHRIDIAATFQSLSEMLETATISQGRLLAVSLQAITLFCTGVIVVVGVFAMMLPLIKLLNDLS